MNKILLVFLSFIPALAFAEYNGYHIEFEIELKDGAAIHGYKYLTNLPQTPDNSLVAYLENEYGLLFRDQLEGDDEDWSYFENRIEYKYSPYSDEHLVIYTLIDQRAIDEEKVKGVRVLGIKDQTYAIGLSNVSSIKDLEWLNTEPVESYGFGGMFCGSQVFIHEKSAETDKVVAALEAFTRKVEKEIAELEKEKEYVNGEELSELEEAIDQLYEDLDDLVSDLLSGFDGMKVAIVTECTC